MRYPSLVETAQTKLVVVCYSYDKEHPIFGHQRDIIQELAKRFEKTYVISVYGLESNANDDSVDSDNPRLVQVTKTDWRANQSKLEKLYNFYRALSGIVFLPKGTKFFFYMTDFHAFLAIPLIFWRRSDTYLWYAHKSPSIWLCFVRNFVDKIFTSTAGSFPKKFMNDKVKIIGQAIDFRIFPYSNRISNSFPENMHFNFLTMGRISPSKNLINIVETLDKFSLISQVHLIEWMILGSAANESDIIYHDEVRKRVNRSHISKFTKYSESIPRTQIANFAKKYNLFIHSANGSLDKTLLEATALGLPVVTTNAEYHSIFGTWSSDSSNLLSELNGLFALNRREVQFEINRRRQTLYESFGVKIWVRNLTNHMVNI